MRDYPRIIKYIRIKSAVIFQLRNNALRPLSPISHLFRSFRELFKALDKRRFARTKA